MRTYQSPLLRYAAQILRRQPDDAQDVVQEAFLRYYHALRAGQTIDTPNQWLHRVTHNLAIDLYRRRAKLSPLADDRPEPADTAPAADEAAGRQEQRTLALAELQRLPEEQRQVVLLKILRGLTLEEISEITGLKVGTVYYRLNQGLRALADRMKQLGAV
jgi:RNA polymerase sigma-70 factor (ECF subfamily)